MTTPITGQYLREKAKRKREEFAESAKKKAKANYEKYLNLCLAFCDENAGDGNDVAEFNTHDKMEKDEALIKELQSRGITADYFTKKCDYSMCDCEARFVTVINSRGYRRTPRKRNKNKQKMSFGFCPRTKQTFAEKFHAGVFEPLPTVSAEWQALRAKDIEDAYVPDSKEWVDGSVRYLFVMINAFDNRGGFYDHPAAVKEHVFEDDNYPADFRWFVIDPDNAEEVEFIADEIHGFWDVVARDAESDSGQSWWLHPIVTHELDRNDPAYQLKD